MTTIAEPAATSWIISKRTDIGLVLGGGIALSSLLFLTSVRGTGFLVVAIAFAMLSDMPHVLQTHVRVLLDPEETRIHARPFYLSLAVIAGLVIGGASLGLEWLLVTLWVYWQPYHVLKQHDGVMQIYAGKHGYKGSRVLGRMALYLGCAAPVLYRMSQGGYRFGEYSVLGMHLPFSGLQIWTPRLPASLLIAFYVTAGLALALLLLKQLVASREERLPAPALATLLVAVVSYNLAYPLVDDLWATILIATAVHSLQYHVLSWLRNHSRFGGANREQRGRARVLAALSQDGKAGTYAVAIASLGALIMVTEPIAGGVIPLTLVLHHFYLDSIVWKRQRNPGLGRLLGMGRVAPAAPSAAVSAP